MSEPESATPEKPPHGGLNCYPPSADHPMGTTAADLDRSIAHAPDWDTDDPEWWRPIPPNLLTLANLVCGCAAVAVMAGLIPFKLQSAAASAAWFILFGALCDGLDGRVARMLGTGSVFGKELDSLADMVTFGVAPGFAIAVVTTTPFGLAGGAVFVCCVALRLARYNVHAEDLEAHDAYFMGLASPAGAILLICLAAVVHGKGGDALHPGDAWRWGLPAAAIAIGLLMVSTIPYRYSGWRKWHLIMPLAAAAIALFVIAWPKWLAFFAVGLVLYVATAPVAAAGKKVRAGRRARRLPKFPHGDTAVHRASSDG